MKEITEISILSEDEFGNPGCGFKTTTQCFALDDTGPGGPKCLMILNKDAATKAGINLEWRKNIDKNDGRPWCPRRELSNSKMPYLVWFFMVLQRKEEVDHNIT